MENSKARQRDEARLNCQIPKHYYRLFKRLLVVLSLHSEFINSFRFSQRLVFGSRSSSLRVPSALMSSLEDRFPVIERIAPAVAIMRALSVE